MNKISKITSFFVLMVLMLLAFQSSISAGGKCERTIRKSSFSVNVNFGLGSLEPKRSEYSYVERRYPAFYEKRIIREAYPRIRERVIIYPASSEYYEEVIICPPRYRERVVVYPGSYWW